MRHWVPIYFSLTDETLGVNLLLQIYPMRHWVPNWCVGWIYVSV
ncbi:hypothetical protein F383_21219 [Gossypium arboreum]|uniref:Uncharacterized protein n=1 Tax=Gossypium arboreum TaxID=29729 RepID=A0A0B0NZZ0_GOSAR|nr:hypothetical protein F383_21219 [Gossypium arboreum]